MNEKFLIIKNLFDNDFQKGNDEIVEILGRGNNFKLEKIISTGQISPEGFWYDQEQDELVFLLEGNSILSVKDEYNIQKKIDLKKGDYLLIKAHLKHRVDYTSKEPPCIWLAIHGDFN